MKIIKLLPIVLILILGLFLRLYKIDNPIADWHSFRQADTASVTREFIKQGINPLIPKYHDLSNIQSGKDNPQGLRMVEFPVYNLLHLAVYNIHPTWGLDMAGRLTSVFLSLISTLLIYLIVRYLSGDFVAFFAALFFAILPFSIYYSRVILPEPMMITMFLASFWFLLQSNDALGFKKRGNLLLSAIFLSIAMLVKPYAIFFCLPHTAIMIRSLAQRKIQFIDCFIYGAIAIVPFLIWRQHILLYPAGIPASDWLLNTKGLRFRPAWFRWLFEERLGKLILGSFGATFLVLGVVAKPQKEGYTYWLWLLGILIYFSVFAGGNVTHDYYQAITIPFIAIILAKGVTLMIHLSTASYSRFLTIFMATVTLVAMIAFSWYDISGYYQINNYSIVDAGRAADKLIPANAKVIAPYNGDTAFLYQTNRTGWPIGYYIEDKIKMGAGYYVSVNFDDETNTMMKTYKIIAKTDKYVIINLLEKNK